MRPRSAAFVPPVVRPVVLLAVLSVAGRAALVDGHRVLASGWPAPPSGVWVAAAVVGLLAAAGAAWCTVPVLRRWHRELDAARGEPSGRVADVGIGLVVVCLVLAGLAASLGAAGDTAATGARRPGLWSAAVLAQWLVATAVVLAMLVRGVVREALLRDVLGRSLGAPGLRSVRGVVVPRRDAVEVRHPVTGAQVAAWYVVGAPGEVRGPGVLPSGRHRDPGPARPLTAELRRVRAVARLLGRQVVVSQVAPFVVMCGGVPLTVDVTEVEVLGYPDTHVVLRAERLGRHADPELVDGDRVGRRLHVLPFGTRVDAVGMVERDGAGWRLRATPARVPGVVAVVRPG
ncbi:hypothetical protein [Cellulomonas phragmiteti]|uniref:Uncharacterized protein n=1 Tax=Cellulomonas phragmiteti TaxID=478780 RepID=A0ABQ4DNF7_9CELL|nr:hypothetical protein [Cellulomonas phragmiteti]GIG40446.1 hypothetical protein Cph01nite_22080 [Cellulomonas phragmiteti]